VRAETIFRTCASEFLESTPDLSAPERQTALAAPAPTILVNVQAPPCPSTTANPAQSREREAETQTARLHSPRQLLIQALSQQTLNVLQHHFEQQLIITSKRHTFISNR
jgi:hypothetical protein